MSNVSGTTRVVFSSPHIPTPHKSGTMVNFDADVEVPMKCRSVSRHGTLSGAHAWYPSSCLLRPVTRIVPVRGTSLLMKHAHWAFLGAPAYTFLQNHSPETLLPRNQDQFLTVLFLGHTFEEAVDYRGPQTIAYAFARNKFDSPWTGCLVNLEREFDQLTAVALWFPPV